MKLTEAAKSAMVTSSESYIHQVIDSIEFEHGPLSEDEANRVGQAVEDFIAEAKGFAVPEST